MSVVRFLVRAFAFVQWLAAILIAVGLSARGFSEGILGEIARVK